MQYRDQPLRQSRLDENLRKPVRGLRCAAGRFDDHGVAGRDGRGDLVRHCIRGRIERRDRAHHPERHRNGEAEPSCLLRSTLERDHLAGEAAGLLGGQSEGLDAAPQLALRVAERESGFAADNLRELLAAALDEHCRAIEDRSAVVRGERRLHIRVVRRSDRGANLILRCDVHARTRHEPELVQHLCMLVAVLPLARDEQSGFGDGRRNLGPL